ncbi:hypothetical protein K443DRAFT_116981, partial [Laccaria amethystina LaAM-08-1]
MSDSHARLFAHAVPGNGSSNTIGENGSDPGENNVIGETGLIERYTPELQDVRHQRTSTPRANDNAEEEVLERETRERLSSDEPDEFEIDKESIEEMDEIVENFRRDKITKLKALSTIISILDGNQSRTERAKDAAVEYYAKTLDEVQSLSSSAVRRGELIGDTLGSSRHSHGPGQSRGPVDHDAEIDDLISQLSRESKNSRKHSSGTPSDDELDSDGASNKKRRIFESEMPWFAREEEIRRSGNKECEESRKILQLFARDHKMIKQWIQTSRTAPLGFPASEWDNIIRGQAVNIDAVFSSLHHISAPKENIGRVGATEISLGRSEPSRKVQTSGEWTSAWNATIK